MRLGDMERCYESIKADKGYVISKMLKAEKEALESPQMEARVLWWVEDDMITVDMFPQGDTSWYKGTVEIYRVSYRESSPVDDGGYESVEEYIEDMEEEIKDALKDYLQEFLWDLESSINSPYL